jgi:hypothetical protein
MKTEFKYIAFKILEEKPKTKVWLCYNKKSSANLGVIKWYTPWRQYCFCPKYNDSFISTHYTVYSAGCLNDISEFIKSLNDELKRTREANSGKQ